MTATAEAEAQGPGYPPRSPEEAAAMRRLVSVPPPPVPTPATVPAQDGAIRIRESAPAAGAPREPLFYAVHEDGAETAWTIPAVAPEYLWANALALTATRGPGYAEVYLMQEMLGMDGWNALLACKGMTRADYRQMVTTVRDKVLGPQEADPNR